MVRKHPALWGSVAGILAVGIGFACLIRKNGALHARIPDLEQEVLTLSQRNQAVESSVGDMNHAFLLARQNSPRLREYLMALEEKRKLKTSGKIYLEISVLDRRLYVKRRDQILKECVISAGSGKETKFQDKLWKFDTPFGLLVVKNKKKDPVWVRPDWAFVEEGLPIPDLDSPERIKKEVMGKYAIYLGAGYAIHGTKFENLIGQNVSHGCIRLRETDLKDIFDVVGPGTKVLIH